MSSTTAQLIFIQRDSDIFQPQIFELENKNRSIGRGLNCDIVLGSLKISKNHATLEYMAPRWYIRDTSTNGLSVNGIRLVKGVLFLLKDTDVISFIPEVRYIFRYIAPAFPLRRAAPAEKVRRQQLIANSPRPSTSSAPQVVTSGRTKSRSRPSGGLIENVDDSDGRNHSESLLMDPPSDYVDLIGGINARSLSPIPSDKDSDSWGPTLTKRKLKVDSSGDDDSDNNTARRKNKRVIWSTSSSDGEDNSNGLVKKNSFLSDEQISTLDDLETLRAQLREWKTKLTRTEVNLQAVECERAMAREELRQKERDSQTANTAVKEETYKKIVDILDSELSCSICNEVFIQATVVDCGHTFCLFCINEWACKKPCECPICKHKFRNRSRHFEIENFINKIFEMFSEEIKNTRKISIREREEQVKKALEDARAAASENPQMQADEDGEGGIILNGIIDNVLEGARQHTGGQPLIVVTRRGRAQRNRGGAAYHADI